MCSSFTAPTLFLKRFPAERQDLLIDFVIGVEFNCYKLFQIIITTKFIYLTNLTA